MRWWMGVTVVVVVACGDNRAAVDASVADAAFDALIDAEIDAAIDAGPFCGDGVVDPDEECDRGLRGLSGDGCSSTCRVESFVVSTPTRETMVTRSRHALAYDASRDRTVMFGGERQVQVGVVVSNDETWEYDGTDWHAMTPSVRPSARAGAAMFYEHGRTIMFGGDNVNDTWTWDGVTWTPLSVTTTPTGVALGAAFDRQRDVGVLATSNGTYEWDGSDWRLVGPPSPAGFDQIVAYAGAGHVAVIDGVDTKFWDGSVWSTIETTRWCDRVTAATYDPAHDRLIAIGYDFEVPSRATRLYEWSGAGWTHLPTTGDAPLARETPVAYDEEDATLLLFGGLGPADTWEWNGVWTQRYGSALAPRHAPTIDFDTTRGSLVVFGGYGQSVIRNDSWTYRQGVWTALTTNPAPEPRINFAHAFDEERDVLVVYGGQFALLPEDDNGADLWELHGSAWTRRIAKTPVGPGEGIWCRATYDRVNHYTLIVTTTKTLTWDGTTLIERTPPPVVPLSLEHDARRGVTVLSDFDQIYEWSGAMWISRGAQNVPGWMVYDPQRGTMLVLTSTNGVWEWDGTSPTQLTTDSPFGDLPPTYDRSSRSLFMFGPVSGWDTTIARWQSTEVDERCDGSDADLDGLIRCADPDCWWRCTPRCPPYSTCDPAAPRCGDGTCSALEDVALCPADCT